MFTSTIINEKGICYLNRFNGQIIKELPWDCFAKREMFADSFEILKYDITVRTPNRAIFDAFFWPVIIDKKVVIHTDAFTGKHFFYMFYSNRAELIRCFLLGVAHFKPEITVDPAIFVNHYIDPENYSINHSKRRWTEAMGLLVCIIFMVVLYFLIM